MARANLAERLEIIGQIFEIDGMENLLAKFDKTMNNVKFNAVVIQIESLLMKNNPELANKIITTCRGISEKDLGKMNDSEYAGLLRDTIITDVMGFFASSPRSGGQP